jgi:hypothetical protein
VVLSLGKILKNGGKSFWDKSTFRPAGHRQVALAASTITDVPKERM